MREAWARERERAEKAERDVGRLTDELAAVYAVLSRIDTSEARAAVARQMSPGGLLRRAIEILVGSDIPGAAQVAAELDRIAGEVDKRTVRGKIYLL
jgi:hypothetical protein